VIKGKDIYRSIGIVAVDLFTWFAYYGIICFALGIIFGVITHDKLPAIAGGLLASASLFIMAVIVWKDR